MSRQAGKRTNSRKLGVSDGHLKAARCNVLTNVSDRKFHNGISDIKVSVIGLSRDLPNRVLVAIVPNIGSIERHKLAALASFSRVKLRGRTAYIYQAVSQIQPIGCIKFI